MGEDMRGVNMKKFLVLFLLMVFAAPFAYGAENRQAAESRHLEAAVAEAKCKADYTEGLISLLVSGFPDAASLSQQSDALKQDVAQLQSYASQGAVDGYRNYVKGSYDAHMKDARKAIQDVRQAHGKNLTKETRASLKSGGEQLKSTFDACHFSAMKSYSNSRVDVFNDEIDKAGARAANLTAKGIDTSNIIGIVNSARSQVVEPLKSDISQAKDGKELAAAMEKYCLHDGCKSGVNFHFSAKFEIEKLNAILAVVKASPKAASQADRISMIQAGLDAAKAALDATGTAQYPQKGKDNAVWSQIRQAAKDLSELVRTLRSG